MTTYDPGFWAEQGQKLLSYYFEHFFKFAYAKLSIEIVWQVATVAVKPCERLLLVDPVIYSLLAKVILL